MDRDNNVNVNGVHRTHNYNVNDNVEGKYEKARKVEFIADELLKKFGIGKESRPFMCKAAYKLPEARLWVHYEQAINGKNPVGLFIWLCKRDGV